MRTIKKQNEHNDPSLETAVSLKKGDFNTPSVFPFLKRKRRLEICYFKTAARLLYFVLTHGNSAAETTVFLLSRWAASVSDNVYQI